MTILVGGLTATLDEYGFSGDFDPSGDTISGGELSAVVVDDGTEFPIHIG